MEILQGYKTWIGLVMTILGFVGVFRFVTQEQVAQLFDLIFQIAGLVVAIYGNYKAHQKIADLEME